MRATPEAMQEVAAALTARHLHADGSCSETHYPEAMDLVKFLEERGYEVREFGRDYQLDVITDLLAHLRAAHGCCHSELPAAWGFDGVSYHLTREEYGAALRRAYEDGAKS